MIHSAVNASPGGGAGLGPMGRLYGARHLLFVKNLSPLVTEEHLRIIFENCSPVLRVEFKTLPGGGRYSEIEFKDSAGITAASQLNGTELMGLSMQISVLDPGGAAASASPGGGGVVGALTENLMRLAPPPPGLSAANSPALLAPPSLALPSLAPAAAGSAAGLGGLPQLIAAAQSQPGLAATPVSAVEIAMQNHLANLQAVQAAAQQAKQLAARKKSELGLGVAVTPVDGKLPPAQSLVSGVLNGEPELEQLAKTCFVHGFAQELDEKEVEILVRDLGSVVRMRMGLKTDGTRYALVEFATKQDAQVVKNLDGKLIGSTVLGVRASDSLVEFRDPDGVLFDVPAPPILAAVKQQQQALLSPEQQKERLAQRQEKIENAKSKIQARLARAAAVGAASLRGGAPEKEGAETRSRSRGRSRSKSNSKAMRGERRRRSRSSGMQRRSRSSGAPSRSVSPAESASPPVKRSRQQTLQTREEALLKDTAEDRRSPQRPLLRAPGVEKTASAALKERLRHAQSKSPPPRSRGSRSASLQSPSPRSRRGIPAEEPERKARRRSRSPPPPPAGDDRRSREFLLEGRAGSAAGANPSASLRRPPQSRPTGSRSRSPLHSRSQSRSQSPRQRGRAAPGAGDSSGMREAGSVGDRRRSFSPSSRGRGPGAGEEGRRGGSSRSRSADDNAPLARPPSWSSREEPLSRRRRASSRGPPAASSAAAGGGGGASPSGQPFERAASPSDASWKGTLRRRVSGGGDSREAGASRGGLRGGRRSSRSFDSRSPRRGLPPRRAARGDSGAPLNGAGGATAGLGREIREMQSRSPPPAVRRGSRASASPGGERLDRDRDRDRERERDRDRERERERGAGGRDGGGRRYSSYFVQGGRSGGGRNLSPNNAGPSSSIRRGGAGAFMRGRSNSLHFASPSPRRGELRSWRKSESRSRSPPLRTRDFRNRGPGGGPASASGEERVGGGGGSGAAMWNRGGGARRGGGEGCLSVSREEALSRRPPLLPPRATPAAGPAVERYKSQSRSSSDEEDSATGGGRGCASRRSRDAPRGGLRTSRAKSERRSDESPSPGLRDEAGKQIPIESRVGDLRRRLQSKRAERGNSPAGSDVARD